MFVYRWIWANICCWHRVFVWAQRMCMNVNVYLCVEISQEGFWWQERFVCKYVQTSVNKYRYSGKSHGLMWMVSDGTALPFDAHYHIEICCFCFSFTEILLSMCAYIFDPYVAHWSGKISTAQKLIHPLFAFPFHVTCRCRCRLCVWAFFVHFFSHTHKFLKWYTMKILCVHGIQLFLLFNKYNGWLWGAFSRYDKFNDVKMPQI